MPFICNASMKSRVRIPGIPIGGVSCLTLALALGVGNHTQLRPPPPYALREIITNRCRRPLPPPTETSMETFFYCFHATLAPSHHKPVQYHNGGGALYAPPPGQWRSAETPVKRGLKRSSIRTAATRSRLNFAYLPPHDDNALCIIPRRVRSSCSISLPRWH